MAGPAIAIGVVGAVLLSLGGAAVGGALENALTNGLPKDELFVLCTMQTPSHRGQIEQDLKALVYRAMER